MPTTKLDVKIHRSNYEHPIVVCQSGSARDLGDVFDRLGFFKGRRALVLIDQGFARARPDIVQALKKIFPQKKNLYFAVPGRESSKSLAFATKILGKMVDTGLTRGDFCLAVGGGVVGDLGGFVASLYHRGIDVVHMPTTLLSMVDSSLGGKTAVNHPQGKNLIGTFHQPAAVIQVLDFVQSLSHDDFQSGLGEVFKYAVGFNARLFGYLKTNTAAIHNRNSDTLMRVILESAKIKAKIVGADERETGVARLRKNVGPNDRRLLNLGHTLGHGIEKAYKLPHGVAVAVGVTLAAKLSRELKLCSHQCYDDIMELASGLALKTEENFDWRLKDVMPYVLRDKKIVAGRVQFVAIRSIGRAMIRPTRFNEFKLLVRGKRE